MFAIALSIVLVILVWWAATGAILYVDGFEGRARRRALLVAPGIAAIALIVVAIIPAWPPGYGAALAGFGAAMALWGANEMLFLSGAVTGPRRGPQPPGLSGWRRFRTAAETLIWHEIMLFASLLLIWSIAPDGVASVAFQTFAVLFGMRLSTKLNLHFGVPNTAEEMLPRRLAYLRTYLRRRAMTPLFPISVTAATIAALLLFQAGVLAAPTADAAFAGGLVTAVAALGVVEHWFLVLPIRVSALWGWGLKSHGAAAETPSAHMERKTFRGALAAAGRPARGSGSARGL